MFVSHGVLQLPLSLSGKRHASTQATGRAAECTLPRGVALQESSANMRLRGDSIPKAKLVDRKYAVNPDRGMTSFATDIRLTLRPFARKLDIGNGVSLNR